jgi:hypothetical protein
MKGFSPVRIVLLGSAMLMVTGLLSTSGDMSLHVCFTLQIPERPDVVCVKHGRDHAGERCDELDGLPPLSA